MCSACMTSSPGGVEERGRAVVALLDVGRVGGADQRRAHLVAGRPQPAGQHLQRDRVDAHASPPPPGSCPPRRPGPTSRAGRRRSPRGARRRPAPRPRCRRRARRGAPASSTQSPPKRTGREPSVGRRSAGGRRPRARPGRDHRQPDVDEDHGRRRGRGGRRGPRGPARSARPGRRGRARAAPGPAARRPGPRSASRRRPRARRPAGPRRPARRSARRPRRRSARRSAPAPSSITVRVVSRRRSEAQRPSAERTPPARGQRMRSMPSSAAIAAACIGPAPPKGSSAKRRGSRPRSTVTTRRARIISWLAIRTIPSAVSSSPRPRASPSPRTAAAAASASSSTPPASRESPARLPSRRLASVTVGSVPPRP